MLRGLGRGERLRFYELVYGFIYVNVCICMGAFMVFGVSG